ncbi:transposase [Streptomyces mirabilis]|uniref:transposase n=1 Tax=Streptomyces mirabilis TaxID=68239 RepID=UPI0036DFC8B0
MQASDIRGTGGGSDRATAPFFDRGAVGHEDSRGGAWRPSGSTPLYEAATPWPTDCTPGTAQSTTRVSDGARILGIDEFAFRKGRTYGTVLVDIETSRPVDVLPDRETGTVTAWLQEHPGAEIVCRDRLMAFTKAIRQAAPDALEVADRWHLLQNLSTAVEKTCRRHRDCLRRPSGSEASTPLRTPDTPLLDRIRRRYAEVNELAATGLSLNAIGRRLQLDRKTVRRYQNKDLAGLLASASSKATSTGSKRSSGKCTVEPHSLCSEPESSFSRRHHGRPVRTLELPRL